MARLAGSRTPAATPLVTRQGSTRSPIAILIEDVGMTQVEVRERMGVHRKTWDRWVCSPDSWEFRRMHPRWFRVFLHVLNLSIDDVPREVVSELQQYTKDGKINGGSGRPPSIPERWDFLFQE